jgi:hypothetical protein
MKDFKLNTSSDMVTTSKDFEIAEGVEEIAQRLRTRLKTSLGEWTFDRRLGLPRVGTGSIFDTGTPMIRRLAMLKKYIADTRGIKLVKKFDAIVDDETRTLSVAFEAVCYDDQTLTINEVL